MLIKSRATEAVAQKIEATMDKEIQIGVKAKVVHYLQLYLAPKKLGSTLSTSKSCRKALTTCFH